MQIVGHIHLCGFHKRICLGILREKIIEHFFSPSTCLGGILDTRVRAEVVAFAPEHNLCDPFPTFLVEINVTHTTGITAGEVL